MSLFNSILKFKIYNPAFQVMRPAMTPVTFKPTLIQTQGILRRGFTYSTVKYNELETKAEMEKAMNEIEELFGIAKDEMEYAEESHGSVYYQEEYTTAKNAVNECLNAYESFLKDLPSDEMRNEVSGKVGMKLKELKMAFEALPLDDH
ncbi:unnamed protein product [Cunninghamella blakesleeana]